MSTVLERYRALHPRSAELYEQARSLFPDGVTHDTRYLTPFPIFMTHGYRGRKWCVDGHEYVDFVAGHGALLLGHAHPEIVSAVAGQVARGTHLGGSTELETRWAEWVRRLIPSAEKVRFTSSGTEATMMALRLARAYTGRPRFIKFQDHFHGWNDHVVVGSGSSPGGVPQAIRSLAVVLPPNDPDAVERALRGGDICAILVEPTGAHMGYEPVFPSFLRALRELADRYGAVLIFDEVVTGFRISPGGAQAKYGVLPDLTTLAKILGGGLPGGAVAGKAEILDCIAHREGTRERVGHPGTFNANPLSASAGAKALELVAEGKYNAQAEAMGRRLQKGLHEVFRRLEVPACCYGEPTALHLRLGAPCVCEAFAEERPLPTGYGSPDRSLHLHLKRALLNEGVDIMGGRTLLLMGVHTEEDIDQTLAGFESALTALRREGLV